MERSHLYGVIKKEIIRTLRRLKSVWGSDYTRLAQKTRLSAGYALDGFVGGKGVCPFPASHFAAFSRELVFNPRFRAARLLRRRKKRSTKVLPCAGAEDEIRTRATGKGTTPLAGEPLEPLGYFCIPSLRGGSFTRSYTIP